MPNNNNNALRFSELDFADVKENLRVFLSNQQVLSDYDVDASVLDVIISTLAYDRQANAITANALFAESDISTAIQRKNISVQAKNFGYTPFSRNASKAVVNIETVADLSVSPPSQLTIPRGTSLTGSGIASDALPFVTDRSYTANLVLDRYIFENVDIFQGEFGSVDIFIDQNIPSQTYEIQIDDIDTNFLEIHVQDDIDSTSFTEWERADTSINITGEDEVYFLQETGNQRYAIQFGDGIIGKAIQNNLIVRVVYLRTSGLEGNNVRSFNFSFAPTNSRLNNNGFSTSVTTIERSNGGFERETDESVKRNAPNFFVSQNRGVNAQDYEDLIRIRFPFINSISVWSGVEGRGLLDQFGRIYISANSRNSQFLTSSQQDEIRTAIIEEFGNAGVIPIFVDVDNTYIDLNVSVFARDFVFLTSSDLEDLVREFVVDYNQNNLERFDGRFEHSQFVSGVDELSEVISSNITEVRLQKRIFPDTRTQTSFNLSFHNPIQDLVSNSFILGSNLNTAIMRANGDGQIDIFEIVGETEALVESNVGQVDFSTGQLSVENITIFRTNDVTRDIRFFATPVIENVESFQNNILVVDTVDVGISRE